MIHIMAWVALILFIINIGVSSYAIYDGTYNSNHKMWFQVVMSTIGIIIMACILKNI